ncbi:MAG: DUF4271 domain-containing protein [Saprospiraceae bacterium]
MKTRLTIFWIICGLRLAITVHAQNGTGENPFELTPRLKDKPQTEKQVREVPENTNPFDLVTPTPETPKLIEPLVRTEEVDEEGPFGGPSFLLGVILFGLVLMTVLVTSLRPFLVKCYRAVLNENMLNQIYRERETGLFVPYFILYLMFFVNAGIFLFLLLKYHHITFTNYPILLLTGCVLLISLLFFLKHLLLAVVGGIFPVTKETSIYSFTIMVYCIMLGLVLAPVNLMIAYAPDELANILILGSLFFIVSLYVIRGFRGLLLANDYLRFNIFHFLLYICTVEIVPVLVLYKLITNQL